MTARVELYREPVQRWDPHGNITFSLGKWRWRFVKNGRVMADSGQGYARRIDCINGCASVLGGVCGTTPHGEYITRKSRLGITREAVMIHDLTREATR